MTQIDLRTGIWFGPRAGGPATTGERAKCTTATSGLNSRAATGQACYSRVVTDRHFFIRLYSFFIVEPGLSETSLYNQIGLNFVNA